MSNLGDHLWRQMGGDVPETLRARAQEAKERFGSGRAAARELGVDEKTVRRWLSGEVKSTKAPVEHRLREERAKGSAGKPVEVKFKFAGRERDLKFGTGGKQKLRPGAEQKIRDAYARGDKERMAKEFVNGVTDRWYRDRFEDAIDEGDRGAERGEDSSSAGVFVA